MLPASRRHARSTGGGPVTDYNDGNWHGWNGGECPVHPKSVVEAVWHDPHNEAAGMTGPRPAGDQEVGPSLAWAHVVKFRVIKQHREPREVWIWTDYISTKHVCEANTPGATLFREVLE